MKIKSARVFLHKNPARPQQLGQQSRQEGWVWAPHQEAGQVMEVSYDVVRDTYSTTNAAGGERKGWSAGAWRSQNIQRKVETDWNMVYLARLEGSDREQQGEIEWRVKAREGERISRVVLRVESTVYHGASVRWQLCGGDICLMPRPGSQLDTNQLAGATQVLPGLEESQLFIIDFSLDLPAGHFTRG